MDGAVAEGGVLGLKDLEYQVTGLGTRVVGSEYPIALFVLCEATNCGA